MNRAIRKPSLRRSGSRPSSRRDRPLLITIGAGLILLLVVGVVFSAAWGSQRITKAAAALHNADETLRSATVAKPQLALAAHMSAVDREFGTNSLEARDVSVSEVLAALSDMNDGLVDLEATEDVVLPSNARTSVGAFDAASVEILDLLIAGDSVQGQLVAEESLDHTFQDLMTVLVQVRNELFAEIEASDDLLVMWAMCHDSWSRS